MYTVSFISLVLGASNGAWAAAVMAGMLAAVALGLLLRLAIVSRAIQRLREAADRLGTGDPSGVPTTGVRPVAGMARSLKRIARQLDERRLAVAQGRSELGAVLSAMVEGVLVIGADERIVSINRAAATSLGLDSGLVVGRSIHEAVRSAPLQNLLALTWREGKPVRGEMAIHPGSGGESGQRIVEMHSAVVHDEAGRKLGAVLVLHDVTLMRRLEAVRREFVANVSHEIRTPISAIKAAAETLLDPRGNDGEDATRFLQIVARQAQRLDAIVNDLLALARLEQESGRIAAELTPAALAPVLRQAVETCQSLADAKRMAVRVECDAGLRAMINAPLLEQAVVNLLENAMKYSAEAMPVVVAATAVGAEVVVSVTDRGRGIEAEHLPRIFERFYRTDKARSRSMGGTGLGLSIVKHVAEAHGGRVSVDSTPGQGSTFRIHLRPVS